MRGGGGNSCQSARILVQILNSFLIIGKKIKYSTNNKVGFMQARWGKNLC